MGAGGCAPGLAFLERYPAWDLQYLADPASLPEVTPALFAMAVMVAGAAGHWAGSRSRAALVASAAALGVFGLVTLPRTLVVGDMVAWSQGTAEVLPAHFIGFALPWMGMSALLLGWTLYRVERARG